MIAAVLFAGIGGWEIAAELNGIEVAWAAEWDDWKRTRYAERWPDTPLYGDVGGLDGRRLVDTYGPLDLLLGSPPCTDISAANVNGQGIDGDESRYHLEAIRLARETGTRWIGFENSPRLRTRGSDRVLTLLGDAGYACWPCVVEAEDAGAPHERGRSFVIGCQRDVIDGADALSSGLRQQPGGAAGRTGPERPSLKRMLTPTSTDNLAAPSMAKWAGARELMALLASAAERLPTRTASNGGMEPDGATGRKIQTVPGRRLATPPVALGRSGRASEATLSKNSRPLNDQLSALGISEATALLAIYLWLMAWPLDYADTAYQAAPSKPSSRAGGRRSATRS